jgi:hypothetical protein
VEIPHAQIYARGYLPLSYGGDMLTNGAGVKFAYWWSGTEPDDHAKDLLRGVEHGATFRAWGSSTNTVTAAPGMEFQSHFRNVLSSGNHDHGALRLGDWSQSANGIPTIIVGTAGGSLIAADPSINPPAECIVAVRQPEDGDHGWGGVALAVANVRNAPSDSRPTIFFGTLHTHAGGFSGSSVGTTDMVSSLHVYELGVSGPGLVEDNRIVFDGLQGRPKLYGLCGIAAGNLDGVGEVSGGGLGGLRKLPAELVLTTMNGDLVVYDLNATAQGRVSVGALRHWSIHDGCLGYANSIRIDPAAQMVHVASSVGTLRLTWSGAP